MKKMCKKIKSNLPCDVKMEIGKIYNINHIKNFLINKKTYECYSTIEYEIIVDRIRILFYDDDLNDYFYTEEEIRLKKLNSLWK